MKKSRIPAFFLVVAAILFATLFNACGARRESGPMAADVLKDFQSPPMAFRSAPLWVWNDRVTEKQIDEQLADFKAKGIGGVFVHPRPGLITPYLSEEWLALFKHAVDVGKNLGMKVWIYDENSYPSGFGGGHVPAAMPDAVRTGLRMTKVAALPGSFPVEPEIVLRKSGDGFEDITARRKTEIFGPGEYYIFDLNRQSPNPWYGGFTYVDLMRPDVTAKFLEVTMEPYRRVFGSEFGGVVPGVFQDEAEISPAGGAGMKVVNWTPRLFETFTAKWKYDLRPYLPSLFDDVGDAGRVRHDYYATLLDLFVEGWAKPYFEYCEKYGLAFTGHYWEHEWPRPVVNPDNLAFAAWSHMPGIDILMNDFTQDVQAQFGNARAVKEIRSAANQTARTRTMSETYGAGGWDLTFFDQKRIADWQYALGVNFVNQHLSYVTLMGARKRDHPQSFSYHEPWWPYYGLLGDYLGRLSVAMSAGRQDNRVLVLEPTTTAWMAYAPSGDRARLASIGKDFQDFVNGLEEAQIEYDLGSEDTLKNHGRVDGRTFRVGPQAYQLVVLPPGMANVEKSTAQFLEDFLTRGGRVLSYGNPPEFVDGRPDARLKQKAAASAKTWTILAAGSGLEKILEIIPPELSFSVKASPPGSRPLLFHHRRSLADADLVFLANTDPQASVSGSISAAKAVSCESWDALTGRTAAYPAAKKAGRLVVDFDLQPGGSLLLCLKTSKGGKAGAAVIRDWTEVVTDPSVIRRLEPNALTLDYCDLTIGRRTEKDLYFYDAQLKTFKAHGLARNPWDSAVQYKTNILDLDKFAPDSGFEASFHFEIAPGTDPASIEAVVERPQLFKVFVNGRAVDPLPDRWWLDKAFGVYAVGPSLVPGRNTIVLKASPFTIHTELEPIYLRGDFGLRAVPKGFRIEPASPLVLKGWKMQGMPFYGHNVSYAKVLTVPADPSTPTRYAVELGSWLGSVAEVRVNGKSAGLIAFAPYRLEITDVLTAGENRIEVVVCGTLKNTLGPFHNNPPLGRAWPGSFQQGAKGGFPSGAAYHQVDYGLFEDFKILRSFTVL